jgi:hypothetical protein
MKVPFVYGRIATSENFTDREEETRRLVNNFRAGTNTVLISPRRWGKTSLVNHVAGKMLQSDTSFRFCFLDMFQVRTEEEFFTLLAQQVIKSTSSALKERMEQVQHFLRHLVPRITIGGGSSPEFSLSFDWHELKRNPTEVLDLPEKLACHKKLHLIICIDEFQNIGYFKDPLSFQKSLRGSWQHQQQVTYCLFGSKRHMLLQLFENAGMPFYKFGDVVLLGKIAETYWIDFIVGSFARTGKSISPDLALQIARKMENHPYFVQQFSQLVWYNTPRKCTREILDFSLEGMLSQNTMLYQKEIDNLSNTQLNFLKALCDGVTHLSSSEALQTYNLGTSANINRIKTSLVSKEIIDTEGNRIEFLDPVFRLWLLQLFNAFPPGNQDSTTSLGK